MPRIPGGVRTPKRTHPNPRGQKLRPLSYYTRRVQYGFVIHHPSHCCRAIMVLSKRRTKRNTEPEVHKQQFSDMPLDVLLEVSVLRESITLDV